MVHVTQVMYKLSAVLSTSAVFHDCNSAINDVITRSQQVQCDIIKPSSSAECIGSHVYNIVHVVDSIWE